MKKDITVKELVSLVEKSSTDFEEENSELKRKYLIWNIETFNFLASKVSVGLGSFGTGYPFYALDERMQGKLPIIQEQVRYNRQLVKDGKNIENSIWKCKSCLKQNYKDMPDLKIICKPCPNMINELKPRKIINRLPDLDMWIICKDGSVDVAQKEISKLLDEIGMNSSDVDPISSINDVYRIAKQIKNNEFSRIFLPIDAHIIEYSTIKELIDQVPEELQKSKIDEKKPYLPIYPKSYRKDWQYDDEAYNFVYDYLASFTGFNLTMQMEEALRNSRMSVVRENSPEELYEYLSKSSTSSTLRRFQTPELKNCFFKKIINWQKKYLEKKEFER
mgnify:FL=1